MNSLKRNVLIALAAAVMAPFSPALLAVEMTRGFNVDFISGPLSGGNFMGTIIYDDANLTNSGLEELGPVGGGFFTEGFLSFELTIGPDIFTLAGDDGYPNSPLLGFDGGELVYLGYQGTGGAMGSLFGEGLFGSMDILAYAEYDSEVESEARFTLKPRADGVPEGGTSVLLMGIAFCGAAAARKWLG